MFLVSPPYSCIVPGALEEGGLQIEPRQVSLQYQMSVWLGHATSAGKLVGFLVAALLSESFPPPSPAVGHLNRREYRDNCCHLYKRDFHFLTQKGRVSVGRGNHRFLQILALFVSCRSPVSHACSAFCSKCCLSDRTWQRLCRTLQDWNERW